LAIKVLFIFHAENAEFYAENAEKISFGLELLCELNGIFARFAVKKTPYSSNKVAKLLFCNSLRFNNEKIDQDPNTSE